MVYFYYLLQVNGVIYLIFSSRVRNSHTFNLACLEALDLIAKQARVDMIENFLLR